MEPFTCLEVFRFDWYNIPHVKNIYDFLSDAWLHGIQHMIDRILLKSMQIQHANSFGP